VGIEKAPAQSTAWGQTVERAGPLEGLPMTEGTSGTAPDFTLRGVESGATLTEGPANPVGTFRTKRSPRFVMTGSHRTPATAPG
jgi:hypothetical protein